MSESNGLKDLAFCKELSPNTLMDEEEASKIDAFIDDKLYQISDCVYAVGAGLNQMRYRRGYLRLGYDNMEEYIQSKAQKIKRRTAYSYMYCDRMYTDRLTHIKQFDIKEMLETCYKNMLLIGHIVMNKKKNVDEWKYDEDTVLTWFHKAHALDWEELKKELRDKKMGKDHVIELDKIERITATGVWYDMGVTMDDAFKLIITKFKPRWGASPENYNKECKGREMKITLEFLS